MQIVKAGPNQYLLVGRSGKLENRGTAVQAILFPGTIHVLIPSTKQETMFEFTQETKDGIPLRFKGIIIHRITNPLAAAQLFDFSNADGISQINTLLTHICLGELRDAVSRMSMTECIEQRKTTLSEVVENALQKAIHPDGGQTNDWGIEIEVGQVAQVFIVDSQLRQQLEAEVRNEIKLKSDQSTLHTKEEVQLAQLASDSRVQEKKLSADKDNLRRKEEMEIAQMACQRRMQVEKVETERHVFQLEQEKFHMQLDMEQDRLQLETPVRLLRIEKESAISCEELNLRELKNKVKEYEVAGDLTLDRVRQEMRREILPIEQIPQIVESASKVLHGTNLSIYGENNQLLSQLSPVFELLTRSIRQAMNAGAGASSETNREE